MILSPYRDLKPDVGAELDFDAVEELGLINCWLFNEQAGATVFDGVSRSNISLVNSPAWGAGAVSFNGSNQSGNVALDLSAYNKITVSFWYYQASFNNSDAVALEFTSNYNTADGSFFVTLNSSSPAGVIAFNTHFAGGTKSYCVASFPRPSAGVWHKYDLLFDVSTATNQCAGAYVDGIAQPLTYGFNGAGTGNFANSTLYLASRASASLFSACNFSGLTIHNRLLEPDEILRLYTNPCWFVLPPMTERFYSISAGVNLFAFQRRRRDVAFLNSQRR